MDFITEKLVKPAGRILDQSHPIVDLHFADGSRCHIIIPPIAANGPSVVLRKLSGHELTADDLVGFGSTTWAMFNFIKACVEARLNILVLGGTGSGKTTILNIIAGFIPDEERVITINGWAQTRFNKPHQVILETREPNVKGEDEITQSHLIASAMKMRPDRIVVGEITGEEMSLLLQALITGHDGSMFSIHAIGVRDALARLEVTVTEGRPQLPLLTVRQQLASGIDLIINQQRLSDGGRRIISITEVSDFKDGVLTLDDIFKFEQTGVEAGRITGDFKPTGYVPRCRQRIRSAGIDMPDTLFESS